MVSSFAAFLSGTWLAMVRATGMRTAAVAVFSIHMERKAAMVMSPSSTRFTLPSERIIELNASLLVSPYLRSASAMKRLPRMRMMMGLERAWKAWDVSAMSRNTKLMETMRLLKGRLTGWRAKIVPAKVKAARPR